MTDGMREVLAALRGKRFPLEDEKATQAAIAGVLASEFPGNYEREVHVAGGIIDFVVIASTRAGSSMTGVEVKIKGQPAAIIRQLKGYAEEPMLAGLILVTSKPVALPDMISGKPLGLLDLARAWL